MENPLAKPVAAATTTAAAAAAAVTTDLFRLSWWWLPRPTQAELATFLGLDPAKVIKDTEGGSAKPPTTAHLERVTLRDGTPAWLRPVLPSDREMHRDGYARLSESSKYHRFISPIPELSDKLLDELVDGVDGIDHIAYYLFLKDQALPVGIGRIIRYSHDREAADIAVTVLDDYQGRGIATGLLAFLVEHRPVGVTRIETVVTGGNPASLAMLKRLGPATTSISAGHYDVRIDLGPPPPVQAASTEPTERGSDDRHRLPHEIFQLDKLILDWLSQWIPRDASGRVEDAP